MDTNNTPLNVKLDSLLPPHYQRNLAPDKDPEFAQKIIEHIVAVHAALKTYLPRYLVEMVTAHPVPGVVSGRFSPETGLFADVSGLTAISEQMSV